jgi:hypothetical protein
MNELLDFESKQTQTETPAPVIIERIVEKPVETPPTKIILGYCKECNKAVSNGEYVVANDGIGVICNECNKEKAIQRAKADKEFTASDFKKGLIWGGIILTLGLLLGLIIGLSGASSGIFDAGTTITLIMVFTVFGYMVSALVAECCWDGSALDVLSFFLRSFQMPGIIFTLDWDGLKFLIAAKIAFAILSAVLSAVVFIIGLIVSSIYASIIFPFSLTSTIKNLKQSYKAVENAENA